MEKLDEETANRLKINDRRRIIRAIEAWEDGDPVSQEKDSKSPFDAVVFGLTMERALLYDRINRRVDLMVEEGLFDEARFFYDQGIPLDSQSMKSIGYRQCVQYFRGEWDKKQLSPRSSRQPVILPNGRLPGTRKCLTSIG